MTAVKSGSLGFVSATVTQWERSATWWSSWQNDNQENYQFQIWELGNEVSCDPRGVEEPLALSLVENLAEKKHLSTNVSVFSFTILEGKHWHNTILLSSLWSSNWQSLSSPSASWRLQSPCTLSPVAKQVPPWRTQSPSRRWSCPSGWKKDNRGSNHLSSINHDHDHHWNNEGQPVWVDDGGLELLGRLNLLLEHL